MTNSETSSTKPSKTIRKWIAPAFIIFSVVGLADASYLTAKHYLGSAIYCPVFGDCEKVITSSYSAIFGVPVSLLGALYYFTFLVLTILFLDTKNEKIMSFAARVSVLGLAASVWFSFLQFFVIKAFCPYCLVSAGTSAALFILGALWLKSKSQKFINYNSILSK